MGRRYHRGVLAERLLNRMSEEQNNREYAHGSFIGEYDYFEKARQQLIQKFQAQLMDDDLYVLMHRDELS